MKIVIAPDSFKESLSALDVALAIREGFLKVFSDSDVEYILVPLSDGGEGLTESLVSACGGHLVEVGVSDPLGRSLNSSYVILRDGIAVIEMAAASGLHLLSPEERNPLLTSTFGTGQMILHAIEMGVRSIIVGLGGSATNDGGSGMAQALGFSFLDENKCELNRGGGFLSGLRSIDSSRSVSLEGLEIIVTCDVRNPLLGAEGATRVFGPQKGATESMLEELELALTNYANVVKECGFEDLREISGSGAGGGMGFGLCTFLKAKLMSGIDLVMDLTCLEDHLKGADLVVTGEGRMDEQTLFGKVPLGVLELARKCGVPVIGVVGSVGEGIEFREIGFEAIFPTISDVLPSSEVFNKSKENVARTATQVASILKLGMSRQGIS